MKIKPLFFAVAAATLFSCNNNDEGSAQNIDGAYKLVSVRGGIAGTNDTFNDGSITWTFENNGTVTVWNTNTDDSKQDLIESGEYLYTFQPNPATPESCAEALYIDGVSYGCYASNGDILTLSQVETDGYEVTLEKLNIAVD